MILLGMFKSAWPYKRSIRRKLLMGNRIFNYRNRDFLQTVIQFSYAQQMLLQQAGRQKGLGSLRSNRLWLIMVRFLIA
jgi:hypothetical protein